MGKKNKHSKDKLYKTVQELKSHHVGSNRDLELSILHRRLRFDSCCLSLNTVSGKPYGLCDEDGFCYVFDRDMIVRFLEKFEVHPITGKKVGPKDLIELKFHKNNDEAYHCPIIYKLFNQYTKIVTNKKTGHVYSYEAFQQLNLKTNNFKDLLTDEPFERSDIVFVQDPDKADAKWNVTEFYYVKNKLKVDDDTTVSNVRDIDGSEIVKKSLEEYKKNEAAFMENHKRIAGQTSDLDVKNSSNLDKINSATYSDGTLAGSVTSTVAPVISSQTPAMLNHEQILYPRIKEKGYVQLQTNFGPINLLLHCDRCPKTCHNFLLLATRGYYDNTCFHRLIKDFIIQGGDPTGTGSGGQSFWGSPFKDECHGDLKHDERGILAMANSGPGTNKSQFYITFKGGWDHLDGKHTVFGKMVGGEDTLTRIESVEVDKNERPKQEIKILKVVKFVDPFEDAEAKIEEERKSLNKKDTNDRKSSQPLKKFRSGIGTYIDVDSLKTSTKSKLRTISNKSVKNPDIQEDSKEEEEDKSSLASKLASLKDRSKSKNGSYGNFSNW